MCTHPIDWSIIVETPITSCVGKHLMAFASDLSSDTDEQWVRHFCNNVIVNIVTIVNIVY